MQDWATEVTQPCIAQNKLTVKRPVRIRNNLRSWDIGVECSNSRITPAFKRDEMAGTERSILDGVPKAMPALSYAQAIQGRAARMGFDWDDYEGVLDKVAEELREIRDAPEQDREGEIGDLLFTVVNACRWLGVEAESALRQTNRKVYARFTTMERLARQRGLDFEAASLDEKEALWEEAKGVEG